MCAEFNRVSHDGWEELAAPDSRPPVNFRPFEEEDRETLEAALERFWEYLVAMDQYDRMIVAPGYGSRYGQELLARLDAENGKLLWAEIAGKPVGFAAGLILSQSEASVPEIGHRLEGRILELFVEAPFRGQGVGRALMREMEAYLISQGCEFIRIEVFAPNAVAYQLYSSLGYQPLSLDLIRRVSPQE